MSVILWGVLAVVFILLVLFTQPGKGELVELGGISTKADVVPESYKSTKKPENAVEHINAFKHVMWITGAFIFVYIVYSVATESLLGFLQIYQRRTDSNSRTTSFDGGAVRRETTTIAAQATRKAGSSS